MNILKTIKRDIVNRFRKFKTRNIVYKQPKNEDEFWALFPPEETRQKTPIEKVKDASDTLYEIVTRLNNEGVFNTNKQMVEFRVSELKRVLSLFEAEHELS